MQKEIIIKKVPLPKVVFYILTIILYATALEKFWMGRYILGGVLIILGSTVFYSSKWEPKNSAIQIKISEDRLWTRNRGNKKWESIMMIKFRYQGNRQVYMDIYQSNDMVADEELNLRGINMSTWKLKRILRKYVKVEND